MPGPVPKRSTERRRRNTESKVQTVKVEVGAVVDVPAPTASWHPLAKDWYLSLAQSGQSQFYEPSDWQAARYVAEVMSRHLKAKRLSAQLFAALWTAMNDLLTTEAERRRVRMELERGGPAPESAGVTALDDYRKRVSSGGRGGARKA